MTKIITIGVIIFACFLAWTGYQYWDKVNSEQAMSEADRANAAVATLDPHSLPGMQEKMKSGLEGALDKAQADGASGLREWLKTYRQYVEDPRLAWIELDYCVLVARENPGEAKKVFAEVKERIGPTSPIYPRIKQLEKTYE